MRNQVIRFLHRVTGPAVGLPALQALFAEVPRCILEELLVRYRHVWRRRYCQRGYRLTWHHPGRVWAMDHSEAPDPIDAVYPYIFAGRDLASHCQLAWNPVATETAQEIQPILAGLFRQHGPPVVLKSDNGSAFIAETTRTALRGAAVHSLFSPARRPQYNGALERSNGVLKTHTHQHAIHEGHPFRWTRANLDHARQLANTISRPRGHRGATPQQAWGDRPVIAAEERAAFDDSLREQRQKARDDLGVAATGPLGAKNSARVDRLALSRTLEALGYLTKNRVRRASKRPTRKPRCSLEREPKVLRESDDPLAHDTPGDCTDGILSLASPQPLAIMLSAADDRIVDHPPPRPSGPLDGSGPTHPG